MYWLREVVYERTVLANRSDLFATLVRAARQLSLTVERQDQKNGVIVVRCLTMVLNLFWWRCWSDKLLFELTEADENRTRLVAYAIPNLLRIRAEPSETPMDCPHDSFEGCSLSFK